MGKSSNSTVYLIHPHSHHSYFTLLALCQWAEVKVICPPLFLNIFLKKYTPLPRKIAKYTSAETLFMVFASTAFGLFKTRIISEITYIHFFQNLCRYILPYIKNSTVIYFQDYLGLSISSIHPSSTRICELIIDCSQSESLYKRTNYAVIRSDLIVAPKQSLLDEIDLQDKYTTIAPYGGSTPEYLISSKTDRFAKPCEHFDFSSINHTEQQARLITVICRSNSYRKGIDLLLSSLLSLDMVLSRSLRFKSIVLKFIICGVISDHSEKQQYLNVKKLIHKSRHLILENYSLEQSSYIELLKRSDIFLMPSRQESSSLAALEALYIGIPSLITEQCGIVPFVSGRHGFFIQTNSASSIVNHVMMLARSPALMAKISTYLRDDHDKFTWKPYFSAYNHILDLIPALPVPKLTPS